LNRLPALALALAPTFTPHPNHPNHPAVDTAAMLTRHGH
jgi:hypothetical protein